MICIIKENPKHKKYRNLIAYSIKKSDVVMFVVRRDRYIKCANYDIINKISNILNVPIEDIESNYIKYINHEYKNLYNNIHLILGKQLNLVNALHKESKIEINKLIKERLIYNIEAEIKAKKNLLLQEKSIGSLKEKFKKYLIKERHNPRWIGTEVYMNTNQGESLKYKEQYLYDICFYRACPEIEEFLLHTVDSLYDFKPPYLPEDISFFKEGYCWLNTITHEKIGYIYIKDINEYKDIIDIGIKIEKYDNCNQNDEELYENY